MDDPDADRDDEPPGGPGDVTVLAEAEPCSICGAAAWSREVCPSCERYCEELMVTGGVRPTLAQVIEAERPRPRPDPACEFCGARGTLAVSGPVGHACRSCLAKLHPVR